MEVKERKSQQHLDTSDEIAHKYHIPNKPLEGATLQIAKLLFRDRNMETLRACVVNEKTQTYVASTKAPWCFHSRAHRRAHPIKLRSWDTWLHPKSSRGTRPAVRAQASRPWASVPSSESRHPGVASNALTTWSLVGMRTLLELGGKLHGAL